MSATSKPRIPITSVNPEGLAWFFGFLWRDTWDYHDCKRSVVARLSYDDGTSEELESTTYSYNGEYFEFVFTRSDPLDKKVIKLEILGRVVSYSEKGKVVLATYEGTTDNPVFDVGDTPSFKVRFKISASIETNQ